jgi:large conductance mechanosensitive channel
MKGFKDFVMRGNLVELAVAFIIAGAFAKVVEAFVKVLMDLIGKLGDQPDFSDWKPGGVSFGAFITVLISFLVLAAIVYFFVVKPYEMAKARYAKVEEDAAPDEDIVLLREIRDALQSRA